MSDNGLRRGGKYDRAMYYRRPRSGEHAGWIVIDSRTMLESFQMRGFEPLFKYGYIPYADPDLVDDKGNNTLPLQSVWKPILAHPDGPSEFPLEQVVSEKWYIPDNCPVKGAKFPQLQGHKITHYPCPECERYFQAVDGIGGVFGLSQHLRLGHDWDRMTIIKYGEKVGIDFDAVYGDLKESFDFTNEAEPAPVAEGCDECDFAPPADSKNPAAAVRMHKMHAHKPIEVEVVG